MNVKILDEFDKYIGRLTDSPVARDLFHKYYAKMDDEYDSLRGDIGEIAEYQFHEYKILPIAEYQRRYTEFEQVKYELMRNDEYVLCRGV